VLEVLEKKRKKKGKKISVPDLCENPTITKIAKDHKVTPAQVCLRWSLQSGIATIPKSVHEERIKQNIDVFNFQLSDSEMEEIHKLGKAKLRMFKQEWHTVPSFC